MDGTYNNTRKILSWAEEDRPREKLLQRGRSALTDAELLAILIGSGTAEMTAVDVGKAVMQSVNNNINNLAKLSVKDLMANRGIGEARAITIIAALELGRRRKDYMEEKKRKLTEPRFVYDEMKQYLLDKVHEEFWIILLNRANEAIKIVQISTGGISGTVVDTRMIFKIAVENLANSIILVHNHPSGQLKPSEADINLTEQLAASGKIMDIPVLDHIIFADQGFYSFADDAKL